MRQALTTVLLLALLPMLGAPVAFAEEEAPKTDTPKPAEPQGEDPAPEPEPEPDPEVPVYSIEYLMPGEDDAPDGWKIRDSGAPAGSPTEAFLEELSSACRCGLDEDSFYFETAVYKNGSAKVAIAMVDMDKSVWTFRQKVDVAAKANGWAVSELGAKGRLLIVGAGEKQADVAAVLKEHVVYQLGHLAMNRVRGRSGGGEQGREAAIAYSEAIGRIAPGTGIAHAVVGVVHYLLARQGLKKGEKPKPAEVKLCAAAWHKAFAGGVGFPPRKSVLVFCAGEYGSLLLMKKDEGVLAEATRVLQTAVDNERDGKSVSKRFGNRYNLACGHARAGATDKAFKMLRAALETASSMKINEFRPQYKHINEKDADMASLRRDPRFSKLMAEFKPAPPKTRKSPHGKQSPHGEK